MPRQPLSGVPLSRLLPLTAATALTLITELLPAGVLPQLAAALHTSDGRVGYLATGYATAATLAAVPLTAASRRLPRRPLLMTLLAGLAAANVATALSSSYLATLAVRVFAGMLNGMLWSMITGYAARLVPARQRGRAIAFVLAGIPIAIAGGIPAASALAGWLGWRAVFAGLAVLLGVLAVGVRALVPAMPGGTGGPGTGAPAVSRLPGVRAVLVVNGLLLIGHQAVYTYIAPLARAAGFGRTSLVLLVFGVATIAGNALAGAVADRWLRTGILATLAALGGALLALGSSGHAAPVLLAAVAVWGIASGSVPTLLQTALINVAGTRHAETAGALQTSVFNAGTAAGALLGGLTLDTAGPTALPPAAAALPLAALLLAARNRVAFPTAARAEPELAAAQDRAE